MSRAEYHRKRREQNAAKGLCRCGQSRVDGRSRCQQCIDADSRSTVRRNAYRKRPGVCGMCGQPADEGKARCEKCRQIGLASLRRLKEQVITAYGGKCECCGEQEPAFLSVDHINDDGAAHRRTISASNLYRWLRKHGFPRDAYRLLCFNCNCGRRINGGVCPHRISH